MNKSFVIKYHFLGENMQMTEDLKRLSEYCKKKYENADSLVHKWGHISRTASGSAWFVEINGGSEREQELAYAAGLLHDVKRKKFDSESHAKDGSDNAVILLKDYSFDINEIKEVSDAIRDHRDLAEWKSMVHQSVYFSDKVFELMGAYMDFRGPFWVGEKFDEKYKNSDEEPLEALLIFYGKAKKKIFVPDKYPDSARNLVDYQMEWNLEFSEALKNNESWAVELGLKMFGHGRKGFDFEKSILNCRPEGRKQECWISEMQDYVKGKKFKKFEKMI